MSLLATVEFGQLLDYRFDAECYRPELLAVEQRIAALKPRPLEAVATVTDGNHVSIAEHYCESGVRYLKGAELSDVFIDDTEPTYIPSDLYSQITRAQIARGDVLLSVIGSVGPVAFVTDKYDRLSCSCKLAILRPHGISGSLLAAYLLSPTGQALLLRRNRGSVQQGVVLPDIRSFPVPKFSDALARKVEKVMTDAAAEKRSADSLYPEAEAEILERIGWDELQRTKVELSYVCDFSEVTSASRSDAEFFQPRCERLRARLAKQGDCFGNLVTRFDKGTQPDAYVDSGEIMVVKSKQVTGRGLSLENCERTTAEVWNDASARLTAGDLVINSTGRGTLGRAAVIPTHSGKTVAAVDVVIARLKTALIHPKYAALYLNSPAGIAQSDQFQTGSSGQLHLYPQHFAQFIIYLPRKKNGDVDIAWQEHLVAKVEAATAAKVAACAKLEEAKQLVEDALKQ
jgi:type I restriction enzyme S subunit